MTTPAIAKGRWISFSEQIPDKMNKIALATDNYVTQGVFFDMHQMDVGSMRRLVVTLFDTKTYETSLHLGEFWQYSV